MMIYISSYPNPAIALSLGKCEYAIMESSNGVQR